MSIFPLVSIIMPTYNSEATIESAINSILLQTYETWELLICDDGSTDDTLKKVERFSDNRIRFYAGRGRKGIANRLNQGISLAHGKYIARMDADDLSFPTRIQKQVNFMEAHPEIDLLGSSIIAFGESGNFLYRYIAPQSHYELVKNISNGIPLYHPTWFGKKEWFFRWRYRNFFLKYGGEDFDLLLRSFSSSHFASLQEPLLAYRHVFSIRRISYNTIRMVTSLFKSNYRKEAALVLLKFTPKLFISFTLVTFRNLKYRNLKR
ncbi:glycosyltransferase [Pedobacter sp. SYSU D00535]|uniref:glycosyltransferase family 2 protein n=1 Tax=Pedobacter sp. SYSU D00535 TaxID=2810308 RepID=UPI001A958C61|nr:glycosyltransferase [Pedobacter sp. SYSU D00535]